MSFVPDVDEDILFQTEPWHHLRSSYKNKRTKTKVAPVSIRTLGPAVTLFARKWVSYSSHCPLLPPVVGLATFILAAAACHCSLTLQFCIIMCLKSVISATHLNILTKFSINLTLKLFVCDRYWCGFVEYLLVAEGVARVSSVPATVRDIQSAGNVGRSQMALQPTGLLQNTLGSQFHSSGGSRFRTRGRQMRRHAVPDVHSAQRRATGSQLPKLRLSHAKRFLLAESMPIVVRLMSCFVLKISKKKSV